MIAHEKKFLSVNHMTKIAMMSVISYVLMTFVHFPLPIFPSFLKVDISDVPTLIGGFAMGPVAGIMIAAVKNLLHLFQTDTAGVGELSNFLVACALMVPATLIYRRDKTKKSALIGLIIGVVTMAAMGAITNYLIILPFYSKIMPIDVIIQAGSVVNAKIVSLESLILYGIVPFNLFKGSLTALVTMVLYKKISPILQK